MLNTINALNLFEMKMTSDFRFPFFEQTERLQNKQDISLQKKFRERIFVAGADTKGKIRPEPSYSFRTERIR